MNKPVDGQMDPPVFVENYASHTRHWRFRHDYAYKQASQVVLVIKNLPANAGDAGDLVLSLGQEDPLEKEMATHSSILAWRIPGTEEPGGLQSIVSHRVRHDMHNI